MFQSRYGLRACPTKRASRSPTRGPAWALKALLTPSTAFGGRTSVGRALDLVWVYCLSPRSLPLIEDR
jgi:hypothetical protein